MGLKELYCTSLFIHNLRCFHAHQLGLGKIPPGCSPYFSVNQCWIFLMFPVSRSFTFFISFLCFLWYKTDPHKSYKCWRLFFYMSISGFLVKTLSISFVSICHVFELLLLPISFYVCLIRELWDIQNNTAATIFLNSSTYWFSSIWF